MIVVNLTDTWNRRIQNTSQNCRQRQTAQSVRVLMQLRVTECYENM